MILPYGWHIATKSLSDVFWLRPRMYRFVLLSWSPPPSPPLEPRWLLRLVLRVPLWEPVLELEELWVLAGDVAEGTRPDPYWFWPPWFWPWWPPGPGELRLLGGPRGPLLTGASPFELP